MDERAAEAASRVTPPHAVVPTLPPGRLGPAANAARAGALVAENLHQLTQYSSGARLPSPDDCGLAMDFDTMASVAFVLAAWAGALLEAVERGGGSRVLAAGDAGPPSGLLLPPAGLILPPGVRIPDGPPAETRPADQEQPARSEIPQE